MKVLLDTSAINWLTDNPEPAQEFFACRDRGVIEVLVTPEAAKEVRDTKDPVRRAALEATLSRFFPLTPTRVPRVGAVRSGLGRVALPSDTARLAGLNFLRDGQDRNLAANAGGYRCDVFLTRDREMYLAKRAHVEAELGGTRVLEPEEFMRELTQSCGSGRQGQEGDTSS